MSPEAPTTSAAASSRSASRAASCSTHEFVLAPRDGLVALPLELRAKVGELRIPLVLELGAECRQRRVAIALDLVAKVGEGRVALAIEFLAEAGQRGVSFSGELLAKRLGVGPVTIGLFAERGQCRLAIDRGRGDRLLDRPFAVVGRDRHHVGEQPVQRLLDGALHFVDNRLGQALNAFVERHRQARLVLSRYTRTLFGRIGHSAAGLHWRTALGSRLWAQGQLVRS